MTTDESDAALRARFRSLAAAEAEAAPPFTPPPRPAPLRVATRRAALRPRLVVGTAAAVLALAALGYARWAWRARPVPFPIDPAAVTWTGPTDFLLETPGAALLRDVPTIGIRYDTGRSDAPLAPDDTSRRNRT
jgi:hypothetical protein